MKPGSGAVMLAAGGSEAPPPMLRCRWLAKSQTEVQNKNCVYSAEIQCRERLHFLYNIFCCTKIMTLLPQCFFIFKFNLTSTPPRGTEHKSSLTRVCLNTEVIFGVLILDLHGDNHSFHFFAVKLGGNVDFALIERSALQRENDGKLR